MPEELSDRESMIRDIENFERDYADRGCSCYSHPPCTYCTHPGNPLNLEEDPLYQEYLKESNEDSAE